jgi:uncharacterized protein
LQQHVDSGGIRDAASSPCNILILHGHNVLFGERESITCLKYLKVYAERMDVSLKPQPLIAEVLPGFTLICVLGVTYFANHPQQFGALAGNKSAAEVITAGFATILISWIIGTVFDTIRDLLEHFFDQWFPVNWKFLFEGSAEEIQKLDESWLAYYFLSGNSAIGLLISGVCGMLIEPVHMIGWWLLVIFLAAALFAGNSVFLRNEIRQMIGYETSRLPHHGVYARIRPANAGSATTDEIDRGVGVFAIRDIPKGTLVFAPDDDRTVVVRREDVEKLPDELRRLYQDFCVLTGNSYTCPVNFNKLTVAWYANNSENPNIAPDKSLRFTAIHDIAAGDELISRYENYSENEGKPFPSDV